MQTGNTSRNELERDRQFQKAVKIADRQFAGGLWDAETFSCAKAATVARQLPVTKRSTAIQEHLREWRERSVDVIRAWAPKFFAIASAFHAQVDEPASEWTKAKLLEGVSRRLRSPQCGAATFWFKFACGERDNAEAGPSLPWNMPDWMVSSRQAKSLSLHPSNSQHRLSVSDTSAVLFDAQDHFRKRVTQVIDDETDRLRITELCDPNAPREEQQALNSEPAVGTAKVVPSKKRPGPKPSRRSEVLREILTKYPKLSCRKVCQLIDEKYVVQFPALAHPEFRGHHYDSWLAAYEETSVRQAIIEAIGYCRPKAGPLAS